MTSTGRRMVYLLALPAVAGLLWFLLAPVPVPVEIAVASLGPLQVTVNEEGETRAQDRFVVSAPVGGRLAR